MDILPPLVQTKSLDIAVLKTASLNLKVNQQLEVKVISSKVDTQSLALEVASSKKTLHVQSNQAFESKPGQTLSLVVTKSSPAAEFKILNEVISKALSKDQIILKQTVPSDQLKKVVESTKRFTSPVIISAKIMAMTADTVQLKLYTTPSIENSAYNKQQQNLLQQKTPIITLAKQQLIPTESKHSKITLQQSLTQLANYKVGQKIQLEVNKSGLNPEFKMANSTKPMQGLTISAVVVGQKNNQLQLQLQNSTSLISVDKHQLIGSSPQSSIDNLKKGEKIQLEVKMTDQVKLKLRSEPRHSEQKILNTIKQLYPTQQPPSEFINQLLDKLPAINKNENIPDALKRLAREILNSTPQIKDVNPKQLKKLFSQSGLFLEANLAQMAASTKPEIDFKGLLLKFQQAVKQQLEIKEEAKAQSTDVSLLKEMQQKSESSLAKTILNQFASLPRDDATRNVWVLDLPFLNKGSAETVRVEIDREQRREDDNEDAENWTVNVTITPQEHETIHCKISCYDQTIHTLFWSDNETVVNEIDQHLDYLKSQLKKAGLNPGRLSANKGIPTVEVYQKIKGHSLFDQKV